MSDPSFEPGDRVITGDASFYLRTEEINVRMGADEWERDWVDERDEASPGRRGTVVRSSTYETYVRFDGAEKDSRLQTKGIKKLPPLDRLAEI